MKKTLLYFCLIAILFFVSACNKENNNSNNNQNNNIENKIEIIEERDLSICSIVQPIYHNVINPYTIDCDIKTDIEYTSITLITTGGYIGYHKAGDFIWCNDKITIQKEEVNSYVIHWIDNTDIGNYQITEDVYFAIVLNNNENIVASVIVRVKPTYLENIIDGYKANLVYSCKYPAIDNNYQNITNEYIENKINEYKNFADSLGQLRFYGQFRFDNYWYGICYQINDDIEFDTVDIKCNKGYIGYMVSEDVENDVREYSIKEFEHKNISLDDMHQKAIFWRPLPEDDIYQEFNDYGEVIVTITLKNQGKIVGEVKVSIYTDFYQTKWFYSNVVSSKVFE